MPLDTSLRNSTILLVEDELLVGLDLRLTLEDDGALVCGPITTLAVALRVAEERQFEGAVLDHNLSDGTSLPLARALQRRGVPFVFYTAAPDAVTRHWPDVPVLGKPLAPEIVVQALLGLIRERSREAAGGSRHTRSEAREAAHY